jgi:Zinc knuckle
LKQQANWAVISVAQDAIQLVILIKSITFKFEDQKFLPLALYQAKANLYNLRQGNMTNHNYLQRFNNLVDVATTYNGQLYDGAIVDIVTDRLHRGVLFAALTADQKAEVENQFNELYQSDRRRYGKLSEELKNAFTKGRDDYPTNLVSAYHLINEYKNWQPRASIPDPTGVAFVQKGGKKNNKAEKEGEDWKKSAKCHACGETGHIRPECPNKEDDDDEA